MSEPVHISEIMPDVMRAIDERMQREDRKRRKKAPLFTGNAAPTRFDPATDAELSTETREAGEGE